MSSFRTRLVVIAILATLLLQGWATSQQPIILKQQANVNCIAVSPDNKFLAIGIAKAGERLVVVWDLVTSKEFKVLEGHANFVNQLVWTNSTTLVALCTGIKDENRGTIFATTWDVPQGQVKVKREFPSLYIVRAVSPDGKLMATVTGPQYIQVWNLQTGKRVALLDGGTKYITCAAFSADGKTLMTAGLSGLVKVWDGQTFEEKLNFQAHGPIAELVVAPTGNRVATWCDVHRGTDGKVMRSSMEMWDLATGKSRRIEITPSWPRPYAFSSDGNLLALKSRSTTGKISDRKDCVQLWDISAGKVAAEIKIEQPFDPHFMAFSPDDTRLVVDTGTRRVLLFTLPLKKQGEEKPPQKK